MTDTAEKIVPHPAASRQDKVYNYTMTFNLGKSAQGQILTDFPQSLPESDVAQRMDMLDRLARRQQARYALDELEQELEDREAQMAQWQLDHGEAEKAYQREKSRIADLIAKEDAAASGVIATATAKHAQRGARTDFELRGPDKKEVKSHERAKLLHAEALKKAEAERDLAKANLDVNIKAAEKQLTKIKAKIAAKRATLGEAPAE